MTEGRKGCRPAVRPCWVSPRPQCQAGQARRPQQRQEGGRRAMLPHASPRPRHTTPRQPDTPPAPALAPSSPPAGSCWGQTEPIRRRRGSRRRRRGRVGRHVGLLPLPAGTPLARGPHAPTPPARPPAGTQDALPLHAATKLPRIPAHVKEWLASAGRRTDSHKASAGRGAAARRASSPDTRTTPPRNVWGNALGGGHYLVIFRL